MQWLFSGRVRRRRDNEWAGAVHAGDSPALSSTAAAAAAAAAPDSVPIATITADRSSTPVPPSQMYGDEEFLRAKKLWKVRPRDVTWKKGRSLRTYQRMLQRFRDWGDDGPTEGVSSGGTPHGTPRGEGGPGDGMTWAVETEHDGSDDEEGTTVQVLALESPRDSPRGSSPVKYAAITSDHVLHAEAASEYLAARHWKCIRDEGLGHDHADTLEIRSTLELLQLEITKLRTASCEHTAAEHTPLLSSSGVIGGAVPIPIGHANSSSAKPPKATRRLELRLEPAAPGTHRDHVGAGAEPGSPGEIFAPPAPTCNIDCGSSLCSIG